jgi:hypothetical protein
MVCWVCYVAQLVLFCLLWKYKVIDYDKMFKLKRKTQKTEKFDACSTRYSKYIIQIHCAWFLLIKSWYVINKIIN